jgi:AbiV family abortive infection protein
MPLRPDTKELALTLIDGLEKTFQNANELYDEALYLAEKGAMARALLLHQISLEACGKADMPHLGTKCSLKSERHSGIISTART